MEIFFNFIKFIIAFVHDLTGGNQWLTTAIFGALAFASRRIPPAVYRPGRVDHLIYFGYPSKQTVVKAIGVKPTDEHYEYINNLNMEEMPLSNIVSLRNAKTLEEAKNVIATRDNYLQLSKASITDQVN